MVNVIVTNKVRDYDAWKIVFDGNRQLRIDRGEISETVYRGISDQNLVVISFEWRDMEKAMSFGSSEELRNAQREAGVIGAPQVSIVEPAFRESVSKAA